MTETFEAILESDLTKEPLLVAALMVTTCAYFFTLCKNVGSLLSDNMKDLSRGERAERLNIVNGMKDSLVLGGMLGAFTVLLIACYWLANCPDSSSAICEPYMKAIPVVAAVDIVSLVFIQWYFGFAVVRHETKRIADSLDNIAAVICLKGGRRLKGGLVDLEMMRGSDLCALRYDSGDVDCVKVDQISRIYLQENVIDDEALRDDKFTHVSGGFTLRSQPGETYRNVDYYEDLEFRVIRTERPDSKTRFVIAPLSEIVDEPAPA